MLDRQGSEGQPIRSLSGLSARRRLGVLLSVPRKGGRACVPPFYLGVSGPRASVQQLVLSARSIHSKQREDALNGEYTEPIWNDVKYMAYNHPNRLDPDLICKGMSVVMRFENSRRFQKEKNQGNNEITHRCTDWTTVSCKPRHYAIAIYALTGVSDKGNLQIPEILAHFDDAEDEEVRKIPLDDLYNVLWALKDLRVRRVPKVLLHPSSIITP